MIDTLIVAALLSGLTGAIFGAAATFLVAQRKLHSENVTAERMKWRDKIRGLADQLAGASDHDENDRLRRQLALNLNPGDLQDREILKLARRFPRNEQDQDELTDRLSLLLKHDWDRAKLESSWWPWRKSKRLRLEEMSR